jgi:hypothetical protein
MTPTAQPHGALSGIADTAHPDTAHPNAPHPNALQSNRALGIGLIAFSLVTSAAIGVLSAVFEFPDILRRPGSEVLPKYSDNASIVRPMYWLLAMTGLALIALSVELGRLLATRASGPARMVTGFGVATGVFWSLGYARWPIAVPYLADLYKNGDKERAGELYELLNRYAGMTVGEHLGFITMGVFAIALAFGLKQAGIGPKWMFPVGLVGGALIAITAYEQYNPDATIFGALNGLANTIWFVWLLALGVVLVRAKSTPAGRRG